MITNPWSAGTSTTIAVVCAGAVIPAAFRIVRASLPMYSLFDSSFSVTTDSSASRWLASSRCPPLCVSARIVSFATDSTTKSAFSPIQSRLLSKLVPAMTCFAASCRSAVSSIIAGGLPGPAAIVFLPLDSAVLTTDAPPVATSIAMSGCSMICFAVLRLAFATEVSRLAGPPALTIASLMTCIVSSVHSRAFGCGLKTTAFPADSIIIAWLITVDVGLVVGVIELITPNGTYSIKSVPVSPDIASDSRSSTPGERVTAPSFFITLCSAFPMFVS